MPYVNIKITDEDVPVEDKKALIKGAIWRPQNVPGNTPATTTVMMIDEVNTDNWGIARVPVTEPRRLGQ